MNAVMPRNRRFAGMLLLVVAASLLVLLIKLGFWQLDRAAEKAAIAADFEARATEPPVALEGRIVEPERYEYYRARVSGLYEPEYQVLIDNAVLDGRPGYRVITPLKIAGTPMRVLVDRGWIPWPADRSLTPEAPAPAGEVHVEGMLKHPAEDYYTLEKAPPQRGQRVWQNLDMAHYRALHGFPLQPLIVVMSPTVDDAGGFERRRPDFSDDWIARHRGYAATWFGLAIVLVVGVGVLIRRRGHGDDRIRGD